ncbi:MAG: sulfite exporter TauE/SafE family protein [bacterium]|nr:sulfite exporter TauE/SafE family protein [bacterium]
MTPLWFSLSTFFISVFAGVFGSLLGLGGGIIIIPALTLIFDINIRYAIGASIVSVIATSSGAAAAYVRERMTNLRVAMLLEVGTTAGAITGAYLAGLIDTRWLYMIFGLMMGYSAWAMFHGRHQDEGRSVPRDPLADRLRLHAVYFDEALGREISYRVAHTKVGLGLMYLAGVASGLLGIGSGIFKVPTMDLAMRLPLKVSSATSNFMIGVTAAASAGVYFVRGDINPFIAGPVALGVLIGATLGARLLSRAQSRVLRITFILVLIWVTLAMLRKGITGGGGKLGG